MLMKIQPIKSSIHNSMANELILAFNTKFETHANSTANMKLKLLPLYQLLMNLPHCKYFFTKEVLFLKNAGLRHFLLTSDNVIANTQQSRSFNQSFNRNKYQPFQKKQFNQTLY